MPEHMNKTATIVNVNTKTGATRDGRAWSLKEIVTNTGLKATTFDEDLGARAEQFLNQTVDIYWSEEEKSRKDGMGTFTARKLEGFGEVTNGSSPAQQVLSQDNPDRDDTRHWSVGYCGGQKDAALCLPIGADMDVFDLHARAVAEHHMELSSPERSPWPSSLPTEQVRIAVSTERVLAREHVGPKASLEDMFTVWDILMAGWHKFMDEQIGKNKQQNDDIPF